MYENYKKYNKKKDKVTKEPEMVEEVIAEDTNEEPEGVEKVVVNCMALNIRPDASKDNDPIGLLPVGSKVKVNSEENGWSQFTTESGVDGYCMSEYLQ